MQEPTIPREPNGRPQVNASNTHELTSSILPSRLRFHPTNNNPSCNSQTKTRPRDSYINGEADSRHDLRMQPQMSDSGSTQHLHAPTQRMADPTQPFLTFDLDLNAIADSDDKISLETRRANVSPSSRNSISRSRSRSRNRSPSRGKANSSTPRKNSSPKHSLRIFKANPRKEPQHMV